MGLAELEEFPEDYQERESSLLGRKFKTFEEWDIRFNNRWEIWSSFLAEMSKNRHGNDFGIHYTSRDERFREKNIVVTFDCDGKGKFFSNTRNSKQKLVRLNINPFTQERVYGFVQDMRINFVRKEHFRFEEHLGRILLGYAGEGDKVESKEYV